MNGSDIGDAMFGGLPYYGEILALVSNSVWAGAVLGLVGGLVGVFVMQRDMAFAVHGISELSFAGAAAALLIGWDVVTGSIVGSLIAAAVIGLLGAKARDRNSIIGVLMPFGLGLGILFLSLYDGRSANRFSLLTGQIVSVQTGQLGWLIGISAVVLLGLLLIWRPLRFDSLDPQSAAARGVPTTAVSLGFMLLLGLIVAVAVHIIGALLVMALLVTPAAAAMRIASGPLSVPLLSALFGFVSAVGGILLAIMGTLPVSPYITTISFVIYVICRVVGARRDRVTRVAGVPAVARCRRRSACALAPSPLARLGCHDTRGGRGDPACCGTRTGGGRDTRPLGGHDTRNGCGHPACCGTSTPAGGAGGRLRGRRPGDAQDPSVDSRPWPSATRGSANACAKRSRTPADS
jgi:zinc/manganese transport system permease protein